MPPPQPRITKIRQGMAGIVPIPTGKIKEVAFTHHASDRMKGRGFTKEQVITAICDADSTCDSIIPGRMEARRAFGGMKAKVVYTLEGDKAIVISVMWESKRLVRGRAK